MAPVMTAIAITIHTAKYPNAADGETAVQMIPATALASLLLLVFFAVSHNSHRSELPAKPAALSTFADASSAVETGGKLVRELPDAALSPLNDERLRLNRDLANAQKFLLASLP